MLFIFFYYNVIVFILYSCLTENHFLMIISPTRLVIKYLSAISFYFVVFAVPIAGNIFGIWLALTLNILNSQYNEGFSSLRLRKSPLLLLCMDLRVKVSRF